MRQDGRIASLLIAAALVLACFAPTLAPPAAIPTLDPNAPLTAIVQTAAAAATQTALMLPPTNTPTATPLPTPTPTGTPTATFIFLLPTLTVRPTLITPGQSGLEYDCQVVSQSPSAVEKLAKGAAFDVVWEVVNIGRSAWFSTDADYRYVSGRALHVQPIYDFPESVPSGGTIKLTARMRAPSQPGTYKTEWRIVIGRNEFCPLSMTITVE